MKRLEYLLTNCSNFRIRVCFEKNIPSYMIEYEIREGRKIIGSETLRNVSLSEAVEEAYQDVWHLKEK